MAKLLVVEAAMMLRMRFRRELEADGHEVFTAGTTIEGLEVMALENPELVILSASFASYAVDFRAWEADTCVMTSSELHDLRRLVDAAMSRPRSGALAPFPSRRKH